MNRINLIREKFPLRTHAQAALKKIFPDKPTPAFPYLIPPREINYNYSISADDDKNYVLYFDQDYRKKLIFLLSRSAEHVRNGLNIPKVLDIGCGFGPLAYALKVYIEASRALRIQPDLSADEIFYSGIDIRSDSIKWLKQAYSLESKFDFHYHKATINSDYIGTYKPYAQNLATTSSSSNGSECLYDDCPEIAYDIQWSGSLFTHLTKNAAQECLNYISKNLSTNGVAVNTWLIVDPASTLSLFSGNADRCLNIDFGDYLSSSEENPLVCTAYKINIIEQLYAAAGLEITEILYGSWRGLGFKNNVTYQDVIVAKKKV